MAESSNFPRHMTFNEIECLQIGDKFDYRTKYGRYRVVSLLERNKLSLQIQYNIWNKKETIQYSNDTKYLSRFAFANTISSRPAHRLTSLQKDDYVSVNTNHQPGWRDGEIKNIDKNSGQIQVRTQGSIFDYWIHLDNKQEVDMIGSHSQIFGTDMKFHYCMVNAPYTKPIYYNNKYILKSNNESIYRYNINKNEWKLLGTYPRTLKLKYHNNVFDEMNNILYLFGGENNCLSCFNIQTEKWNVSVANIGGTINQNLAKKYNTNIVGKRMHSVFIPAPINEIHLITQNNKHVKFDKNKNKFIYLSDVYNMDDYSYGQSVYGKLIYNKFSKQLFFFKDKFIYFCQLKDKQQIEYKWKLFEFNSCVTKARGKFEVIFVDNNIVMMCFMNGNQEFHFIDLYYKKIFQSETLSIIGIHLLKCSNNMIHLLAKYKHIKFCLNDIITNNMEEFYRNKVYNPLIFGFVREFQHKLYQSLSFYISKLIISYYSQFMAS